MIPALIEPVFPSHRPARPRRAKYAEDSAFERKSNGFELVRVHHQTLTRMFCDDPDGTFLNMYDICCVWEEFVDALRDATAKADDPVPTRTSVEYREEEKPIMQRSSSFAKLVKDLSSESAVQGSPMIDRNLDKGMILGVGCSSGDNSARGGYEYFRLKQEKGRVDAVALIEQLAKKGLTRDPSEAFGAGAVK